MIDPRAFGLFNNPLMIQTSQMMAAAAAGGQQNFGSYQNFLSQMQSNSKDGQKPASAKNSFLISDILEKETEKAEKLTEANQTLVSPASLSDDQCSSGQPSPNLLDESDSRKRRFSDSTSPSHDDEGPGKKPRKARTIFTDKQLSSLEESFEKQKYLSVQDRMELAQRMNLSDTQVKTWYQNRRLSHDHDRPDKQPRKARTIFTNKQLSSLEESFEMQKYLSVQDRTTAAAHEHQRHTSENVVPEQKNQMEASNRRGHGTVERSRKLGGCPAADAFKSILDQLCWHTSGSPVSPGFELRWSRFGSEPVSILAAERRQPVSTGPTAAAANVFHAEK